MAKLGFYLLWIIFLSILMGAPRHIMGSGQENVYVVNERDTLPAISKKYSVPINELIVANGLQSKQLKNGQKLWVPIMYEVTAGDTLKDLAATFHSSIETIKKVNNLTSEQVVAGQLLRIPPKPMEMRGQHILMTKEEFKDWLFHNKFNREIRVIQQHHTWAPSYKRFNGANHFQLLNGMEEFHKKKMKWTTIAQNITTFPDGKVAVSRPFDIAPEGSIGEKANSIGITIENLGNFDKGYDEMTKEQKETIIYITALLCIKFGLTPSIDSITYHHWWNVKTGERVLDKGPSYNVKTCPGTAFFGGNSTESAKKYFYPLVSQKMKEIMANGGGSSAS